MHNTINSFESRSYPTLVLIAKNKSITVSVVTDPDRLCKLTKFAKLCNQTISIYGNSVYSFLFSSFHPAHCCRHFVLTAAHWLLILLSNIHCLFPLPWLSQASPVNCSPWPTCQSIIVLQSVLRLIAFLHFHLWVNSRHCSHCQIM